MNAAAKSHTDAATISRLSANGRRILKDYAYNASHGLAEYNGAAGSELAIYELRDAGCGNVWLTSANAPRITLSAKGRRLASKV